MVEFLGAIVLEGLRKRRRHFQSVIDDSTATESRPNLGIHFVLSKRPDHAVKAMLGMREKISKRAIHHRTPLKTA